MRVRVLYFGVLREHMGSEGEDLPLPEGSSVATLLGVLERRKPTNSRVWEASAVALNLHYLRDQSAFEKEYLSDGDEVAFLPPVSGGGAHAG